MGDLVRIRLVPLAEAQQLAEGHGGWGPDMAALLGTTGTIERVWGDGDLNVRGKMWNPAMIESLDSGTFQVGQRVQMTMQDATAYWTCCPGSRLSFSPGYQLTIREIRNGFFTSTNYDTLWAPLSAARVNDEAPAAASTVAFL